MSMIRMTFWGLAILVLGGALPAFGTQAAGMTPGRLPIEVTPSHYAITLEVDPDATTFRGSVRIAITVAAPTDRVVLNAKDLMIRRAIVEGQEGASAQVTLDTEKDTATLFFDRPLTAGAATLALDYEGKVNEATEGLFVAPYQTPQGTARMLATQFEAADARRVFPGWDE